MNKEKKINVFLVVCIGLIILYWFLIPQTKAQTEPTNISAPSVSSIIIWEETVEQTLHWRPINKPLSNELFTVRIKLPLNYTYSIQRSMDDGQWIIYGSTADTFMVVEMVVGHSYKYKVGAHDSTGIHYSEESEEYTP